MGTKNLIFFLQKSLKLNLTCAEELKSTFNQVGLTYMSTSGMHRRPFEGRHLVIYWTFQILFLNSFSTVSETDEWIMNENDSTVIFIHNLFSLSLSIAFMLLFINSFLNSSFILRMSMLLSCYLIKCFICLSNCWNWIQEKNSKRPVNKYFPPWASCLLSWQLPS